MRSRCTGRIQRGILRAFAASGGEPLLTRGLLVWAYPRVRTFEQKHYRAVHRAATRFAVRLGRKGTRRVIWGPNDELMRLIKGDPH
jgi:hypothetical protein